MLPLLVALVLSTLATLNALPNGAPTSVCDNMLPFHGGGIPPLTTKTPFTITPQSSVIGSGQTLKLDIESFPANIVFKGYMLQARQVDPPNSIVGHFVSTDTDAIKLIECQGPNDTATHTSTSQKRDLTLEWTAPEGFVGDVVFNATIAQDYDKFWVGIPSDPVRVVASQTTVAPGSSPTKRPATTTTVPPYRPPQTSAPVAVDPIYAGCGESKGCFGFPDGCVDSQDCRAVVTIAVLGARYVFELKSGHNRPAYVAFGLSNDAKMGDDSVLECVPEQGTVNAYASWTNVGPYGSTRVGVPQNIFQVLEKSYNDGTIYCKLERNAVSTVKGQKFDLMSDKFHLLLAAGSSVESTNVNYHDIGRHVSGTPQSLAEVGPVQGSSKLLLRLHGAFMITAWIGTASLGILLARYFRQTWVGSQMCGKDQWFAWHRFLMVLTWALTVAGVVVIFVEIGGWSQVRNPHAILGVVTTVLCFLQPLGAFFRPHPGSSKRPWFNWLHWLGGNLAHVIAIVAIFFAVQLQKAELPDWMDFILVAFVAFHVFMHLIFSIFSWVQIGGCVSERRSGQRVTSFPMADMTPSRNSMSSSERKQDAAFSGFRKSMLFLYILIVLGLVIAMVVIVVLAPIETAYNNIKEQIMN
ncbi:putative ferric-chelate reductase 1 homolog isoform X1 [Anopheles ziemanni]|uniref:putative ferric-chelate reductase 1 homolog isoform X1 n=1 Tax=Anopheles coustani TaxID=139045 RepID=UPI00265AB37E|nr:putative ferric-chelate reductase 1 homolog isoform X1 [Anopheles coustani]XP_058125487.1 putative ferric-chelate reductase 1 homolog isoform X1 [Anopheles coustani]XP_058125488.1 putative ferric-chelate reductase 1 homolog isoform X1 [Anopheles coustani]XP_058125489.1 putative ferric-chelate reductase 1 homolog isoform X1 [Anopheles coustani]XP_058168211.1 putative ferric-chelate reductase 1 homolog isoform X1 [Anopheles ziemanni]XP_058168212.1 putative ferric-chelate reductase 1 homolog i